MVTANETLDQKIERLESLVLNLRYDYHNLQSNTYMAVGANSQDYSKGKTYLEDAEKHLAKIEQAIKNYRDGVLQDFERVEK